MIRDEGAGPAFATLMGNEADRMNTPMVNSEFGCNYAGDVKNTRKRYEANSKIRGWIFWEWKTASLVPGGDWFGVPWTDVRCSVRHFSRADGFGSTDNWDKVMNYLGQTGFWWSLNTPSEYETAQWMEDLVYNSQFSRTSEYSDVVDALFGP